MSQISITRVIEFDAAHRLIGHESKCKYVHGHHYVVEASFTADQLDHLGRVVDFGIIKDKLQGWVDKYWDHTLILHQDDHALGHAVDAITGQASYYMPNNPTAEHMAQYLADKCAEIFAGEHFRLTQITVSETPRCSATIIVGD